METYEVGSTDIMFIFADWHKRPSMLMPEQRQNPNLLALNLLFLSNIPLSFEEGAQRKKI